MHSLKEVNCGCIKSYCKEKNTKHGKVGWVIYLLCFCTVQNTIMALVTLRQCLHSWSVIYAIMFVLPVWFNNAVLKILQINNKDQQYLAKNRSGKIHTHACKKESQGRKIVQSRFSCTFESRNWHAVSDNIKNMLFDFQLIFHRRCIILFRDPYQSAMWSRYFIKNLWWIQVFNILGIILHCGICRGDRG